MSTPAERGDLAERMLPIAAGLACLVHGDGDQRDIAHVLRQLDHTERDALIVVLAGLINPDSLLADTLSYLTWDEHGHTAPATKSKRTIREIAVQPKLPSDLLGWFLDETKTAARIKYHQLGEDQKSIGAELGVNARTIARWVNAPRKELAA